MGGHEEGFMRTADAGVLLVGSLFLAASAPGQIGRDHAHAALRKVVREESEIAAVAGEAMHADYGAL